VVPEQDLAPWSQALRALLEDRTLYERESENSRRAALRFVERIRPERMEEFLRELQPARAAVPATQASRSPAREALEKLSPERRALLVGRLRKHTPGAT
jgi:hypothetical protein